MPSITERLIASNKGKDKELINDRYKRMEDDAFAFCRGTCDIFYGDLRDGVFGSLPDSPTTWISGDLHVANFGTYRAKDGKVHFDLNDFDEAALAPALWEVLRLITSVMVLCNCQGMKADIVATLAIGCLNAYIAALTVGAIADTAPQEQPIVKLIGKAEKVDVKDWLDDQTKKDYGKLKFRFDGKDNEDKRKIEDEKAEDALKKHMTDWARQQNVLGLDKHKVVDAVFRIAGTGSIGLNRYLLLLHEEDNYLILEMKEAEPSAVRPQLQKTVWNSEAARVLLAQQRMQRICPALLATTTFPFDGKEYVVRQFQPEKKKIKFDKGKKKDKGENDDKDKELTTEDFKAIFTCMGRLTAYAQLRSAGKDGATGKNELIAFGESSGEWSKSLLKYAQHCAAKTDSYFRQFKKDRNDKKL